MNLASPLVDQLLADARELIRNGRPGSALTLIRKGILLEPARLDLRLLAGDLLHTLGRDGDALTLYDETLRTFPDSALLYNNRGVTLLALGRNAEAAESFGNALLRDPSLDQARVARATALMRTGDLEGALSLCEEVIARSPDDPEAHWNRALIHLSRGEYREGFAEYEWRWRRTTFTSPLRHREIPLLERLPVTGVRILVHAEQGLGDAIQFCRWIPLLAGMGNEVVFECHGELVRLMTALLPGIRVVPFGGAFRADCQIPLLSLPHRFGVSGERDIPPPPSYVRPPQEVTGPPLRAGICWRGKAFPDPGRSLDESALAPLAGLEGVEWHSLTVGASAPRWMRDLTPAFRDFWDTANYMGGLRLVVTIDSSPAHLAGTLGMPTILMLPKGADWRWGVDREESPWYPGMRIFRQRVAGEWGEVVERVRGEILRMKDLPA